MTRTVTQILQTVDVFYIFRHACVPGRVHAGMPFCVKKQKQILKFFKINFKENKFEQFILHINNGGAGAFIGLFFRDRNGIFIA